MSIMLCGLRLVWCKFCSETFIDLSIRYQYQLSIFTGSENHASHNNIIIGQNNHAVLLRGKKLSAFHRHMIIINESSRKRKTVFLFFFHFSPCVRQKIYDLDLAGGAALQTQLIHSAALQLFQTQSALVPG